MTEWLSPINVLWAGALVVVAIASWWVRGELAPEPELPKVKTDTVTVQRQITKQDTVTETVPRKVIQYDTIRATRRDTIRIEVPTVDTVIADTTTQVPLRPFGLISARPVRVDGTTFTLSYYQLAAQRWEQRTYKAQPDAHDWRLTSGLEATAGPGFGAWAADLQLKRRTALGWVGVGPAYSVFANAKSLTTGAGVTVSFNTTLYSR
jgi:hypothetical protein